ncbi:MAG: GNAT family N-acetyltransferase [Cohnella sp.]|nr:GNAT family N-acetyltransferase [Cohnella sp.]
MKILETERLVLRWQTPDDAGFILKLMTDPSWIRYIGDRNLKTVEDARDYIVRVALGSYERLGYGFYLVELKGEHELRTAIGICGLAKRDFMEDPDVGYAFLPAYWGKGYAYEATAGVLRYARDELGIERIAAITTPDNEASIRLLAKLGMRDEGLISYGDTKEEVKLYRACE